MSVLPKETIQVMADASGFPDLPDAVAVALAADLEYRLREITQVPYTRPYLCLCTCTCPWCV